MPLPDEERKAGKDDPEPNQHAEAVRPGSPDEEHEKKDPCADELALPDQVRDAGAYHS
jgi:hypothetical protein